MKMASGSRQMAASEGGRTGQKRAMNMGSPDGWTRLDKRAEQGAEGRRFVSRSARDASGDQMRKQQCRIAIGGDVTRLSSKSGWAPEHAAGNSGSKGARIAPTTTTAG